MLLSWSEFCSQQYNACCRDCWTEDPPWPFTQKAWYWHCCNVLCQGEYMICIAECAVNAVVDAVVDLAKAAADFVKDNPGLVVGTIVVIAGVVLIATLGPGGAVVLVAA